MLSVYFEFASRYSRNGQIIRYSLENPQTGYKIAKRIVDELSNGGNGKYNLLFNNCESFANRVIYGYSFSWQSAVFICGVVLIGALFVKGSRAA